MQLTTMFATAACALAFFAPAPAQLSSGSLAAALESVKAENISADIYFIADDQLAGRDTPSEGLQIAARFLRARLMRLGWQPGAKDGYFYTYPLSRPQIDEEGTHAAAERDGKQVDLKLGRDYWFSSGGLTTAEFTGDVVFVGAGEEQDFAAATVNGKWALCYDDKGSSRRRQTAAREAGAVGVIQMPGPTYSGDAYPERFARNISFMRRGQVAWPAQGEKEPVFPFVYMDRQAGIALLELAHGASAADWTPELGADLGVSFTDTRKEMGKGGLIELENVCGFWPGSDPELGKEVIIISAHYDHVGVSRGEIHNGADDNGSGSVGLLAIAEALSVRGPLPRSVLLMWVSGEEKGLLGSRAWTEAPWLPEGCRPILDINIDMIGRNAPNQLLVTPTKARKNDYNGLTRLVEQLAPLEGFTDLKSADEYWNRSDHANFRKNLDIPVAFLFTDVHEDYHQPGDDPEKIDCDKVRRVVRVVVRMIEELQAPVLDL